jgi:hypothetical protein
MVSGPTLQQQVSQKVQEIKQAISGLSEENASKQPAEGEWCVKEVLSHLTGEENAVMMYQLNRILEEDTPTLTLVPGVSAYTDERKNSSLSQLLSTVEAQYSDLGKLFAGMSEEQLSRKAHIPFLKESPLGEYPTLGQWAMGIINFHLADHVSQISTLAKQ